MTARLPMPQAKGLGWIWGCAFCEKPADLVHHNSSVPVRLGFCGDHVREGVHAVEVLAKEGGHGG